MRYRLIVLTFAISIVPVVMNTALAATVDVRSITCSEYLAMPAASSDRFSGWMTGWFSYQSRRTYVDFGLQQTNVTNVRAWCQSNPGASVMVALEKSIGVNALPGATLDFNKITCGTWLGYGPADRDFVTYFMSGYYNANASNSVLDYDRLQRNAGAVAAYCKKNRSRTLPTAIQNRASY
jgi:HdeA/HdeB family